MKKIIIFGNSSSGKSTLAKKLAQQEQLPHLDLDTIAWLPVVPPTRSPLVSSKQQIDNFIETNDTWVIEGCYTDLLALVVTQASEIIFMNLPIELCIENAKNRSWEEHKYSSKTEQDANLPMLIEWISQYQTRKDTFSLNAHQQLFNHFKKEKTLITSNR